MQPKSAPESVSAESGLVSPLSKRVSDPWASPGLTGRGSVALGPTLNTWPHVITKEISSGSK